VNTRRVVYCLICAVILYSASAVASRYMDYSRYPLSKMFEEYSGFKANFQAGSNYNVGAAAALMVAVGKKGGREVLPFLEEESFDPETHELIRSAAAKAYVNIASVEECIEFMRKAFGVNDDKGFWRFSVSRQFLAKIGAAFDADETSDAIKQRALLILLEYMQAPANPSEASKIDEFLAQKCEGYRQSWQRMDVAQRFLGGENEKVDKHYRLIHESVTQFPPEQRIDLRKRFPDLPPLPGDAPARSSMKVALAIIAGVVALAVCAVAAWLAARRRKVRKAA